ncbi:MAG TPA: protein jag [Firmicutes bacterium]|nr:protein jag [Candidatus Fermentithermobacillaceae bacterium]
MRSVEKTGRTVDEAIGAALAELGVPKSDCRIEVLAEPSRGFLGILGTREARVRVTVKESRAELAKAFLAGVLERMNTEAAIEVRPRGDTLHLDVVGKDMGILIGRRGDTLRALEFLTNLASSKGSGEALRVVVDVSGYRKRRERELEEMARNLARRVMRTGQRAVTQPLEARDRRIVHLALQGSKRVTTHSEGEEPFRRVVISPKERPGPEDTE